MYRPRAGSMRGVEAGGAAPGGILTTWLIRAPRPARESLPRPPSRGSSRARRTRTGFPRPRASRPLTTHGAPRSAAASRAATRADVALYSCLVCDDDLMISFMLISARWFSCRVTAVRQQRNRECRMFVDVSLVYFSIGIRAYSQNQFREVDGAFGWDLRSWIVVT